MYFCKNQAITYPFKGSRVMNDRCRLPRVKLLDEMYL